MPSRFGDDIIAYATTSKLPGFTTLEFARPIAVLPERVTASRHSRLIPSVGKRASASLNAANSSPASSKIAGTSSPAALSVSAIPWSQKAAQVVCSAFVCLIAYPLVSIISFAPAATAGPASRILNWPPAPLNWPLRSLTDAILEPSVSTQDLGGRAIATSDRIHDRAGMHRRRARKMRDNAKTKALTGRSLIAGQGWF